MSDRAEKMLMAHAIIGAEQPRQGMAMVVPELHVLCVSCGWMRASAYTDHLVPIVHDVIRAGVTEVSDD